MNSVDCDRFATELAQIGLKRLELSGIDRKLFGLNVSSGYEKPDLKSRG